MAIIWGSLLLWALVHWGPFYNVKHMGHSCGRLVPNSLWSSKKKTNKKKQAFSLFVLCWLSGLDKWWRQSDQEEFGFLYFELQLLRGICGPRGYASQAAIVDDMFRRPCITAASACPSLSLLGNQTTHLHLHPLAHLSFRQHKPCRLFGNIW